MRPLLKMKRRQMVLLPFPMEILKKFNDPTQG